MPQVVIEKPVLNSPFLEPARHFRFTDEGISDEIVEGRRTRSYFIPIAKPKKKSKNQWQFDTEWTAGGAYDSANGGSGCRTIGFECADFDFSWFSRPE
jgi:hypothetical protein